MPTKKEVVLLGLAYALGEKGLFFVLVPAAHGGSKCAKRPLLSSLLPDHGLLSLDGDARLGLLSQNFRLLFDLYVLVRLLLDIDSMDVPVEGPISRQLLDINAIEAGLLTEHSLQIFCTAVVLHN